MADYGMQFHATSMAMNKAYILEEIKRTANANGGVPLGSERFASETGVNQTDWYGKFWARWSDARVKPVLLRTNSGARTTKWNSSTGTQSLPTNWAGCPPGATCASKLTVIRFPEPQYVRQVRHKGRARRTASRFLSNPRRIRRRDPPMRRARRSGSGRRRPIQAASGRYWFRLSHQVGTFLQNWQNQRRRA